MKITNLALSWSVSRAQDTYGYNICRLFNPDTQKYCRCSGGGYDMIGTVFAAYLNEQHQDRLLSLANTLMQQDGVDASLPNYLRFRDVYGLTFNPQKQSVHLEGASGIDCMIRIAERIGLSVKRTNLPGHKAVFTVIEA